MEPSMFYDTIPSPLGPLVLVGSTEALTHVGLPHSKKPMTIPEHWRHDAQRFIEERKQFSAFFKGELTRFDLPLEPHGTAFQLTVWKALSDIPYGETINYAELARRIGNPKASRAVGLANGANPLAIVIPCHRVIGADGSLTGYGGGLEAKQFLLAFERKHAPTPAFALRG
jgi:methylated-DNA-[protein]-cysteine S-methyltransferase